MTTGNVAFDGNVSHVRKEQFKVGAASATISFLLFTATKACIVKEIGLISDTTIATDAANTWTLGVLNKGVAGIGTDKVVDGTLAANGTNATGGSAITNFVARTFALTANINMIAGESLYGTLTKGASATTMADVSGYIKVKGAI